MAVPHAPAPGLVRARGVRLMGSRSLHLASTAFPARRGTSTAKPAATNFPILGSQILGSPIPDLRSAASGMTMERTVVVPALRNASGLCALLCLARKAAGTVTAQDLPPLSSPRKRRPRNLMSLLHKLHSWLTVSWFPACAGMTDLVEAVAPHSAVGSDTPELKCIRGSTPGQFPGQLRFQVEPFTPQAHRPCPWRDGRSRGHLFPGRPR